MIFEKPPIDFRQKFEVSSGYLMCNGKILVVQRSDYDSQGGKWAFPGGTVEKGETLIATLIREIKEETDITLEQDKVIHLKKLYVRYSEYDFCYNIFYSEFEKFPDVTLNKENKGYLWLKPQEILKLDMVADGQACVELFMKLAANIKI